MGRRLFETQPVFRQALQRCDELLGETNGYRLLGVLYPPHSASPIDQTMYAQPALFALGYALAETWKSWGIEPDAVMGQLENIPAKNPLNHARWSDENGAVSGNTGKLISNPKLQPVALRPASATARSCCAAQNQ